MRVGDEVKDVLVKLVHNRSIFGPISGVSGVSWEQASARGQSGD